MANSSNLHIQICTITRKIDKEILTECRENNVKDYLVIKFHNVPCKKVTKENSLKSI